MKKGDGVDAIGLANSITPPLLKCQVQFEELEKRMIRNKNKMIIKMF